MSRLLSTALVLGSLLSSTVSSAQSLDACRPETSWKTVSDWQLVPGKDATMSGMAAYTHFAYAVGFAQDATSGYWVVRRSSNNGNTWSTVNAFKGGAGRGIAADPRNGILYTVGVDGNEPEGEGNWIVRKSTNRGVSWTRVDKFVAADPDHHTYQVDRVAVDGKGAIIVVGHDTGDAVPFDPIMRRSTDAGATWTTIPYAAIPFHAFGVFASASGQVFVVGDIRSARPTAVGSRWAVLQSPNGVSGWTVVDAFTLNPANIKASSYASDGEVRSDGTVVVVGAANKTGTDPSHLIVRTSKLGSLSSWNTTDNYQPFSLAAGFGSAGEENVTFGNVGRIFTNGKAKDGGSFTFSSLVREGKTTVPFITSDDVLEPSTYATDIEFVYSGGMATLGNGQVVSGSVINRDFRKAWFIRKMSCPF